MSFDKLPWEIKLEIVKYCPKFKTLSTQYNKEKQLYYDMYGQVPISKKEMLDYINTKPEKFMLFMGYDEGQNKACILNKGIQYIVDFVNIEIEEFDTNEYQVIVERQKHKKIDDFEFYIQYIFKLYDIKMDLVSQKEIYDLRGFHTNYSHDRIQKQLVLIPSDISTLDGMYQSLTNLLFMKMNVDMYNHGYREIYDHNDFEISYQDGHILDHGEMIMFDGNDMDVYQAYKIWYDQIYNSALNDLIEYNKPFNYKDHLSK